MSKSGREEGRVKVHSLGYMEEKLKRNLRNSVERYILTATTFIKVGNTYKISERLDERKSQVYEIILCSEGIEGIINNIETDVSLACIVPQELAESKRILSKMETKTDSGFYHHIRNSLQPYIDTVNFPNKVRDIGYIIRDTVRQDTLSSEEEKLYIKSPEDINFTRQTIRIIETEYKKLRRRLVGL